MLSVSAGVLTGQRRCLVSRGWSTNLQIKGQRGHQNLKPALSFLNGPKMASRRRLNYMEFTRRNRSDHHRGTPWLTEALTMRKRPEKDLPFGTKFFSKKAVDDDSYLPQVDNPYDDGRAFKIGLTAKITDLTPYLLHEVDDRISEAEIRHDVAVIAANAETVADFLNLSQAWGWLEQMEACSSRLIVRHLQLLATVIASQVEYLELRRRITTEKGILRTQNGDRFYALPGSVYEHI